MRGKTGMGGTKYNKGNESDEKPKTKQYSRAQTHRRDNNKGNGKQVDNS